MRCAAQLIPYMLVVGEKEAKAKQVSVRQRKESDTGTMSASEFVAKISQAELVVVTSGRHDLPQHA